MGGGAWPFLVGGVSCLVDSVNERDLCCIIRGASYCVKGGGSFLGYEQSPWEKGRHLQAGVSFVLYKTNTENVLEVIGKNRSVMPFDVLGCTRAIILIG